MEIKRFVIISAIILFMWISILLIIGHFLKDTWNKLSSHYNSISITIILILVLVIIVIVLIYYFFI